MKKLTAILIICTLALALCVACTTRDNTKIRVALLKGPTGMGAVKLIGDEYPNYEVSLDSAPDSVTSKFISGEVDVAAVPINLASVLYNRLDGDVVVIGITTLGVLHIIEDGNSINSIQDLAGKTLYATGQASTPEYIINYLLEKNGIANDVTVEYLSEHAELATRLGSGDVKLGMLPEPNVTVALSKNADLRIALDLTEEWDKVSQTRLIQGVLIARRSFVLENKAAIKELLKAYKASSDFVNSDSEAASELMAQMEILPSKQIALSAIGNLDNVFYPLDEQLTTSVRSMLDILFQANPASVGGSMPKDDFYYMG